MARTRKATSENGTAPAKRRWWIVANTTLGTRIIAPDNRRIEGKEDDLVIAPYDFVALSADTPWREDYNLEQQIEQGYLHAYETDTRPRRPPARPQSCDLRHPRLNAMLWEMVFGKRANAEGFITAEPRWISRPGEPINRDWLKETGWRVLHAAREWLLLWGPPDDEKWRLEMVERRIEEIRIMP